MMLELYLGFLITGVLFAIVTVIFGDLLSNALGALDFLSVDHLHAFQPMVLLSGLTVCGGAGILLTRYTSIGTAAVLLTALLCSLAAAVLIYFLHIKPMENGGNSVAYSKIAEPMKSIDKLTVVDTGHGEGAARVSNYVTSLMATAPEMLKSVSGIDLDKLVNGLLQRGEDKKITVPSEQAETVVTKLKPEA